jgi:RND family efflux transporter MFP subunit
MKTTKIYKPMKKIALFALAASILFACNPNDPERLKQQITSKKSSVVKLEKEIEELEKTLSSVQGKKAHNLKATKVRIKKMSPEVFNHYFEASGKVEAIESAFISPEMNGQIQKIYVHEGERVKKGDRLAKLNTTIIENSISELETSLELAEVVYEKQKRLFENNVGSEIEFLQSKNNMEALKKRILTTKSQLELAFIEAPIEGIIDNIFLKEGELAVPGMQLMQLINLNQVKLNVDVPDSYLPVIKEGDLASISFPAYPDMILNEPVTRIGNVINDQNLTFEVNFTFPNHEEIFKPNTLSIVRFNDYTNENALTLPSLIVKQDISGSYVYIATTENNAKVAIKKYVTTGKSYGDLTVITEGLNTGEEVIIEGYNLVSDGQQIDIIR